MFTKEEEELFNEWWVDTGFDTDFISEETLRKIWKDAYHQGFKMGYRQATEY